MEISAKLDLYYYQVIASAEYTQAGVLAGNSVGFHYGEESSVTRGDDPSFTGAIGKLSPANADKAFPWTLFVYRKLLPKSKDKVLVLEYCYEGQ